MKHTNHFKKGFTAVELFFVIVVIVALAAFLIPHFMNLKNVKNETAAMQEAANVLSRDLIHAGGALTNMDDVTVENGEEGKQYYISYTYTLKEGDTLADNSYTTEDQITYTKASEGTVGTEYYVLGIFNGIYDAETDGYTVSIEKSGKTYNCVFEKNEWTVKAK